MSFLAPKAAPAPIVPTPEAPPPPIMAPIGSKPRAKNQRSTFLGSDATPAGGDGAPSGNPGGKTLLGA